MGDEDGRQEYKVACGIAGQVDWGGPVETVSERDVGRRADEVGCGVGPGHGQKGKLSLHSGSVPGRGPGLTQGWMWGRSGARPEKKAVTTQQIGSREGLQVNAGEEGNGVGEGLRVRKGAHKASPLRRGKTLA